MRKSFHKPKKNIKPQIVLVVGFCLWAISISGVFGNSGFLQAYRLNRARNDLVQRTKQLEIEKHKLETFLVGLEKNPAVQEVAVRDVLGFVRDGELVFEFLGKEESEQ